MKNFSSSLILIAVALLLGAYVFFFERGPVKKDDEKPKLFSHFVADDVQEMDFESGKPPRTIDLQKDAQDHWRLTAPRKLKADEEVVRGILTGVSGATPDDSVSAPAHLSDYGLDHPAAQAEFKFKDGQSQTLLVGDKDMTGNSVYVQLKGQPTVYLVSDYVVQNLVKTVDDLRDHSLIQTDLVQAGSLRVTTGGKTLELRKNKDNSWDLTAPVSAKADPTKVRDVLTSINDLRVDQFETDHPSDLKIYGLAPPSSVVEVGADQPGVPPQTLLFGRQKLKTQDLFAKMKGSPTVFLVAKNFVKSLDLKPADFRDKSQLQFDASQAERITVSHGAQKIVFVKDSQGRWGAVGRDNANDEGSAILSQLALLTISDFPGGKADPGTAHPAYGVEVRLTGGVVKDYAFGKKDGTSIYLKVKGMPDLYLVPATAEAPLEALFHPVTPTPSK